MGRPKQRLTDAERIGQRLDVLDRLLTAREPIHPVHCDCAIKSRVVTHHLPECPYRHLMELSRELRQQFSGDSAT